MAGSRRAQQASGEPKIDADDIGGVVTSAKGPEAGVWVIAETTDLPTKFVKIVVTDDRGRYLVPDLPKANYNVWVRGYGLVDSPKVKATPGKSLNLKAVVAPDAKAAAEYYPALYWFSLLQVPPKSDFPGTGPNGKRHCPQHQKPGRVDPPDRQHGRLHWLSSDGRQGHARNPQEHPQQSTDSKAAWDHRIQSGTGGRRDERPLLRRLAVSARWRCTRTGPTGLPAESCRRPLLRVRKGRSATSSSRCGTGRIPKSICMTTSRATNGIRP